MRHGEIAWSISRQHIGRADNPPTKNGEDGARQLNERISTFSFKPF